MPLAGVIVPFFFLFFFLVESMNYCASFVSAPSSYTQKFDHNNSFNVREKMYTGNFLSLNW